MLDGSARSEASRVEPGNSCYQSGVTPLSPASPLTASLIAGASSLSALDDRFPESCHNEGIHLAFRTPI